MSLNLIFFDNLLYVLGLLTNLALRETKRFALNAFLNETSYTLANMGQLNFGFDQATGIIS